MTEEELEQWATERIAAIRLKLRFFKDNHPEHFWEEIDSIVNFIVDGCIEIGDTDWPEDLHLGDVLEKHLIRHIVELQRKVGDD